MYHMYLYMYFCFLWKGKGKLFVTNRPLSLRNNIVNIAVEILLKSFAGSYYAYKYIFFSDNSNLKLNSPRI